MLEYFSYKKIKKHQAEKRAEAQVQSPVLTEEDENFLERIVSAEGTPPALPERPQVLNPEAGVPIDNDAQMSADDEARTNIDAKAEEKAEKQKGKGKEIVKDKEKKKSNRFSFLHRSKKSEDGLKPTTDIPDNEAEKEEDDINRVLDELNLAAVNNRAFSISKESQKLVQDFTVILKDLVNGVPTAYDDLVKLIDNSSGTLSKNYDHMPSFLKKLVTSLPQKFTSSLAPELLAVATEAQVLASPSTKGGGGLAGKAKRFMNLKDLVTKPGAVAGMLKVIMNTLKLRWPAFMGTNVLLSVALFVLLFVFWYCHKRGKEVRLERESRERMVDSNGRVTELEDDAMLPPPGTGAGAAPPMNQPARIDAPSLQNINAQNGPVASGYAFQPAGDSQMHERHR